MAACPNTGIDIPECSCQDCLAEQCLCKACREKPSE